MINFLEAKYGAKAFSSQVSQDGYEASNLINCKKNYFHHGNSGFLAEHFIRPPVEVIFSFPHSVEVSSIHIGLRVGSQITDGVEILATYAHNETALFQSVFRQCPILKAHLIISNGRFRPRPPFVLTQEACEEQYGNDTQKASFRNCQHLFSVKSLKVRIIKTSGSSIPALGSVKVWGQPAGSCHPLDSQRILELYNKDDADPCSSDDEIQILPSPNSKNSSKTGPAVQVPEEFLDPLTFEIMAVPVLLPSGQTVDRSTLEKANNSQASWGHQPYDPFTGITFGPGRQPISNNPLKARIDAFLVKNSHLDPQLATVPRAVGSSRHYSTRECPSNDLIPPRQAHIITNTNGESSRTVGESSAAPQERGSSSVHQMALNDSLQQALSLCLKRPSVVRSQRLHNPKASHCSGCEQEYGSFYKLPCSHKLCRTCLFKANDTCPQCRRTFLKEQVSRTYDVP